MQGGAALVTSWCVITRRETLVGLGASAAIGCTQTVSPTGATPNPPEAMPNDRTSDRALDEALEALHGTDPEFGNGLSNHGPMACEALEALGASDRIPAFVTFYRKRLEPMPPAHPLTAWADELGQPGARADLIATMEARTDDPDALVASVVPELLSGIVAGAMHGLLRTAHAYRAWTRQPSPARAREVAHGLGYWAARHQPLPGSPGARRVPGRDALATLSRTPIVAADRRADGLIFERFTVLGEDAGFIDAVEALDLDAQSPDAAIDALVCASARLLATTKQPRAAFVYLHGVTGSAALRLLLPALSDAQQRIAVGYLVQAVAAIHATHGGAGEQLDAEIAAPSADSAELAARAAESRDDHTIKLVEAALREHASSGAPELLHVAAQRVA